MYIGMYVVSKQGIILFIILPFRLSNMDRFRLLAKNVDMLVSIRTARFLRHGVNLRDQLCAAFFPASSSTAHSGKYRQFLAHNKIQILFKFGPKKVLNFAPFLVIFQILAPNFLHIFKFSSPKGIFMSQKWTIFPNVPCQKVGTG